MNGCTNWELPFLVLVCWWQGWVMNQLDTEPWVFLGLVPAHWWVRQCPVVAGWRVKGPIAGVNLLLGGARS